MTDTMTPFHDLRAAAKTAGELAAELAHEADHNGRLAPRLVQEIATAGFPRHFVPTRWGGAEASFAELTDAVAQVGEGCASAAWCAAMFAYTARFAAHLPLEGQHDLWSASPDVLLVPGLVPAGHAVEADGGHRLEGRWNYVSGVEFANWALIAAPTQNSPRFFALPRKDFTFERTWNAVGMRATGSHTLLVAGAYVPIHRSVPFPDVTGGVNHVSHAYQHNVPLPAVGGLTCLAPSLGAARCARSACTALVAGKRKGGSARNATSVDMALADADAGIDIAGFLVERITAALDRGDGPQLASRNARDAAYAAKLLVSAVNELMGAGGTAAQDQAYELQRCWRNVTIASSHAALGTERSARAFAETLLS
ncbi:MAG: hypothetical protein JWN54_4001 [Mycobacterium sp.]|nr:hypothetical protein [Mycobacterium sp.]